MGSCGLRWGRGLKQGVDGVGDKKGRVEGRLGDLMERETEGVGRKRRQQKDTGGMSPSAPDSD